LESASTTRQPLDTLRCFGSPPTIVGTEGADVLVGTKHHDVILGLGGDDSIYGGGGHAADLICAGDGADGVLGSFGRDHVAGEGGDDVLLGDPGGDVLLGGDDIDYIEPGRGNDWANGGGSSLDILTYLPSASAVRVDFTKGRAVGEGWDRFRGFNAVVGSNGDDTLNGATGEELFVPAGGDDYVDGGPGADAIVYALSTQGVNVNLAGGLSLGEGSDTLAGLEVVSGSPFDDVIVGDARYNWLSGSAGNDQLDGLTGDDSLFGEDGADSCVNGLTYVGCENQGGDVFPVPPDPTDPPDPR
jgi:Ca2+-binding RTX toxin-like protein